MISLLHRLLPQKYLTILIAMLVSSYAYAGCDSGEGVCKVVTGQEEKSISCQVKVCASANDYMIKWDLADGTRIVEEKGINKAMAITINGKPAIAAGSDSDEWSCFSLPGASGKYCMKPLSF
ncbi:hypothetical protein [Neptuniibacter halophilus]|uniref:hypothetical protein n=1 Tax=Neptuniibacter halophilus TaxID=651666 RepID=UPI0025748622|nr:hypothetical protein [Neptuniibacter halophilus]